MRGRIVINPQVLSDKRDGLAVAYNEAYRVLMELNNFVPKAEPTQEQIDFFSDTAYADDPVMLKRTITARVATYDSSVPNPTPEQYKDAANMLKMVAKAGVIQNQQEEEIVMSTLEDMKAKAKTPPVMTPDPSSGVAPTEGQTGLPVLGTGDGSQTEMIPMEPTQGGMTIDPAAMQGGMPIDPTAMQGGMPIDPAAMQGGVPPMNPESDPFALPPNDPRVTRSATSGGEVMSDEDLRAKGRENLMKAAGEANVSQLRYGYSSAIDDVSRAAQYASTKYYNLSELSDEDLARIYERASSMVERADAQRQMYTRNFSAGADAYSAAEQREDEAARNRIVASVRAKEAAMARQNRVFSEAAARRADPSYDGLPSDMAKVVGESQRAIDRADETIEEANEFLGRETRSENIRRALDDNGQYRFSENQEKALKFLRGYSDFARREIERRKAAASAATETQGTAGSPAAGNFAPSPAVRTERSAESYAQAIIDTVPSDDRQRIADAIRKGLEYGRRPDGSLKQSGWRGEIKLGDGRIMTELTESATVDGREVSYPLIYEGITDDDLKSITEGRITDDIRRRAQDVALGRIRSGNDPFYSALYDVPDGLGEEILRLPDDKLTALLTVLEGGNAPTAGQGVAGPSERPEEQGITGPASKGPEEPVTVTPEEETLHRQHNEQRRATTLFAEYSDRDRFVERVFRENPGQVPSHDLVEDGITLIGKLRDVDTGERVFSEEFVEGLRDGLKSVEILREFREAYGLPRWYIRHRISLLGRGSVEDEKRRAGTFASSFQKVQQFVHDNPDAVPDGVKNLVAQLARLAADYNRE